MNVDLRAALIARLNTGDVGPGNRTGGGTRGLHAEDIVNHVAPVIATYCTELVTRGWAAGFDAAVESQTEDWKKRAGWKPSIEALLADPGAYFEAAMADAIEVIKQANDGTKDPNAHRPRQEKADE